MSTKQRPGGCLVLAHEDLARELDEWDRAGRELAAVDPDRFRRYLNAALLVVEMYEADDPSAALARRWPLIGGDDADEFDA